MSDQIFIKMKDNYNIFVNTLSSYYLIPTEDNCKNLIKYFASVILTRMQQLFLEYIIKKIVISVSTSSTILGKKKNST